MSQSYERGNSSQVGLVDGEAVSYGHLSISLGGGIAAKFDHSSCSKKFDAHFGGALEYSCHEGLLAGCNVGFNTSVSIGHDNQPELHYSIYFRHGAKVFYYNLVDGSVSVGFNYGALEIGIDAQYITATLNHQVTISGSVNE